MLPLHCQNFPYSSIPDRACRHDSVVRQRGSPSSLGPPLSLSIRLDCGPVKHQLRHSFPSVAEESLAGLRF